jgi:phage/plasmid-associated DNA primase
LNNANASILKALVGGDPLNAEIKGVTDRPVIMGRYLVLVTSNSRLTINLEGDEKAYRRRLVLIEYSKEKPDNVIVDLSEQLLEKEASGILNWMLDGLDELKGNKFVLQLSTGQQRAVDDLLLESESHKIFVKDCIVKDDSARLTTSDCLNAYSAYCKSRKGTPLPQRDAGRLVAEAITSEFQVTQSHDITGENGRDQRGWKGLKLITGSSL